MEYHINAKELLAISFSQKTFVKVPDAQVKLLSYNTTTYMASTLINLIFIIPYLKSGIVVRAFGLLPPTFQEKRTMMQIQNRTKDKPIWNGC